MNLGLAHVYVKLVRLAHPLTTISFSQTVAQAKDLSVPSLSVLLAHPQLYCFVIPSPNFPLTIGASRSMIRIGNGTVLANTGGMFESRYWIFPYLIWPDI